ncbi:MAG: hypothetical protein ACREAA_03265, partial [Candidatus Polarisedimenticolia bacterium]
MTFSLEPAEAALAQTARAAVAPLAGADGAHAHREPAPELILHRRRDTHAARLCEGLQSGGDVDRVPVDPIALDAH